MAFLFFFFKFSKKTKGCCYLSSQCTHLLVCCEWWLQNSISTGKREELHRQGSDFHGSSKTCRTYPLSHRHQPWPPPREEELLAEDFFSSIFIDWVSARGSNFVTFPAPGAATTGFPAFIPFDTGMRVGAGLRDDPSCPVCKIERQREFTRTKDFFFSFMFILYFSLALHSPLKQQCPGSYLSAN